MCPLAHELLFVDLPGQATGGGGAVEEHSNSTLSLAEPGKAMLGIRLIEGE
jgi:hypothetical protein